MDGVTMKQGSNVCWGRNYATEWTDSSQEFFASSL